MKLLKITPFILFAVLLCSADLYSSEKEYQGKYAEIFKEDYTNALTYFKKNRFMFHYIFKKHQVDEELLLSIVFPERIRYSIIRNYLETKVLETAYIELGLNSVDFSIGDLQIKPSFVEKIEKEIESSAILNKKYAFLLIKKTSEKEIRKERIRRLNILAYQIHYISAFYDIVFKKFNISDLPKSEQIRFSASAYNHGFDCSRMEIEEHINVKYFPYGAKYPGTQYAYTEVAVDFFTNYYQSL